MTIESLSNGVVTIETTGDTHTIEINNNAVIISGVDQIQSDWNQNDNLEVDYIKNKPTIPTNTSDLNNDSGFIDSGDASDIAAGLDAQHLLDFEHENIPIEVPFDGIIDEKKTVLYNGILYKTTTEIQANETPDTESLKFEKYIGDLDQRLSDPRTPTAHKSTHATGGSDALSPGDIGAKADFTVNVDTTPVDTDEVISQRGGSWLRTTYTNFKVFLNAAYVTLAQTTAQTIGSATNRILKSWHTDIDATNIKVTKAIAGTTGASGWVLRNNADTANIIQVDEANGRVGIGVAPGVYGVNVVGIIRTDSAIYANSGNGIFSSSLLLGNINGGFRIGNSSSGSNAYIGIEIDTEKIRIYKNGSINTIAGQYQFKATSPTADTVGDTLQSNQSGVEVFEKITGANATKGSGTKRKTQLIGCEKTLSNNVDANLIDINCAVDTMQCVIIDYSIAAKDTAAHTVRSHIGYVSVNVRNQNGVITSQITHPATLENDLGVITDSWTATAGTNKVTLSLTANASGMTPTAMTVYFDVKNQGTNNITLL